LARHDALLDLHSFHTAGMPFVMVGPQNNDGDLEAFARADEEAAFARCLGVSRFVDGWLDTYATGVARRQAAGAANADARYGIGTTEFMRAHGGIALTLECGQHADAVAPEVAYQAIRNSLAHFGLIDAAPPAPVVGGEALRLVDVIDRAHADDRFVKAWASFDALADGELIGVRHDGREVRAPFAGRIVFPNPAAAAGQEWFYLARAH
jgi:predicted deacylase